MKLIGEFYQPELAFLPIGDHYTMDPHQAAHAARMLQVKRVIPMHYGTFPALTGRPEELSEKLRKDGIEVLTMEPGQTNRW
jgi:L-ascorbate metabolism protein UlaG (beta-lactamase superfamily)